MPDTASQTYDEDTFDIFVSYSGGGKGYEVALAVSVSLSKRFQKVYDAAKPEGKKDRATIRRNIVNAKTIVVVIGPEGIVDTSRPDEGGQEDELQALMRTDKNLIDHQVIPILVREKQADGTWGPSEHKLRKRDYVVEWLLNAGTLNFIPLPLDENWRSSIENELYKLPFPEDVKPHPPEPAPEPVTASATEVSDAAVPPEEPDIPDTSNIPILDWERAYVNSRLDFWLSGQFAIESRPSGRAAKLLRYRTSCFVEPFAADKQKKEQPIFDWLLNSLKDAVTVVVGPAGVGKSTILTQLGLCFATATDELLADDLRENDRSLGWLLDRANGLIAAPGKIPVLIQTWQLCESLPRTPKKSTENAFLLDWLAGPDVLNTPGGGKVLLSRMIERPYAILVDNLGGASSINDARMALMALNRLRRSVKNAGGQLQIIVTSRPDQKPDDVQHRTIEIQPFNTELIDTFAQRFAQVFEPREGENIMRKFRQYRGRAGRQAVTSLLGTPLFLNATCNLLSEERSLFDQKNRVEFCENMIEHLLCSGQRGNQDHDGISISIQRSCLEFVAHRMVWERDRRGEIRIQREIDEFLKEETKRKPHLAISAVTGRRVLKEICSQTGILERHSGGRLRFAHNLFMEHLAASYIATMVVETDTKVRELIETDAADAWGPVVSSVPGILSYKREKHLTTSMIVSLLDEVVTRIDQKDMVNAKKAAPLLFSAIGRDGSTAEHIGIDDAQDIGDRLTEVYKALEPHLPMVDRYIYRRRFDSFFGGVQDQIEGLYELSAHLKRLTGISVGTESFRSELTSQALGRIIGVARFPVLVAEYRVFLEDPEREDPNWKRFWPHIAGDYRKKVLIDDDDAMRKRVGVTGSESWFKQLASPASPVGNVTFHEAVAYCSWLTEQHHNDLGPDQFYRLPTLEEWCEIAARSSVIETESGYPETSAINAVGTELFASFEPGAAWPVGLMPADSQTGLFDFGVNVANFLIHEEWGWPPSLKGNVNKRKALAAGGTWLNQSFRDGFVPACETVLKPGLNVRKLDIGFRIVLAQR
ncbi:MAG: SUMF1/EgtB/PvdO family nonheme iron enzyme [Pseudomonadota bacterium]